MRARILSAAAAICLLPVASFAQDGLRSASLPERPVISTPSPPVGDLFRAGPDTYRPRRHSRPNMNALPVVVWPGYGFPGDAYYMSPLPYGNVPCAGVVRGCPVAPPYYYDGEPGVRYDANGNAYAGQVRRNGPAEPPPAAAPAPAPPPLAPGVPKTFYVIAGCYAGDKPPRPEWVPPDCDLSSVRVIPP